MKNKNFLKASSLSLAVATPLRGTAFSVNANQREMLNTAQQIAESSVVPASGRWKLLLGLNIQALETANAHLAGHSSHASHASHVSSLVSPDYNPPSPPPPESGQGDPEIPRAGDDPAPPVASVVTYFST